MTSCACTPYLLPVLASSACDAACRPWWADAPCRALSRSGNDSSEALLQDSRNREWMDNFDE